MAELDDNTRTGLHALGLGLLVIGVTVLIVELIDLYQTISVTTDHHTLQIFRNGYLLPQSGPQFCVATTTRMERIGMAALAALLAGGGFTVLSFPFRRWLSPWAVGRWSAAVVLLFFMWSALVRPPRSVLLEKDRLTIVEHPTLSLGVSRAPQAGTRASARRRVLHTRCGCGRGGGASRSCRALSA